MAAYRKTWIGTYIRHPKIMLVNQLVFSAIGFDQLWTF